MRRAAAALEGLGIPFEPACLVLVFTPHPQIAVLRGGSRFWPAAPGFSTQLVVKNGGCFANYLAVSLAAGFQGKVEAAWWVVLIRLCCCVLPLLARIPHRIFP